MDNSLDLKNGVLSFTNPNYHLDPADINKNPESLIDLDPDEDPYQDLYEELDAVCHFSHKPKVKSRCSYAQLGIESMGIDLTTEPSLENQPLLGPDKDNNIETSTTTTSNTCAATTCSATVVVSSTPTTTTTSTNSKHSETNNNNGITASMGRRTNGFLDYYMSLETAVRQRRENGLLIDALEGNNNNNNKNQRIKLASEWNNSSEKELDEVEESEKEIPHIHGSVTDELYALPVKRRSRNSDASPGGDNSRLDGQLESSDEVLPTGWEKHEDDDGPYYWHISSGTIQREPPQSANSQKPQARRLSRDLDIVCNISSLSSLPSPKNSSSSVESQEISSNHRAETQLKRQSYPQGTCCLTSDKKPIRFAVRSLGWVEIAEEDLTPERSSKAVNKCIVDLSLGRNDILDVVGRWGDGKDLYMDLDDYCLRLINPQDFTVLNTQPIHTIRVWGVGRDNGRDFAYVARDRSSRKHMCHVFRCDMPARIIANTLRDICKKIMIERSLHQNLAKPVGCHISSSASSNSSTSSGGSSTGSRTPPVRPTNLPTEQRRFHHTSPDSQPCELFPTPMEEPKKVLKAYYLGTTVVKRAVGMEMLNAAIDRLTAAVPREKYKFVNVAVAPSTITVMEPGEEGKILAECRVRFLSFLGIGRHVKSCGFVMHTAQDHFIAHIFHCEPSSGALCKTIEAACKLRYQKCLDAHHEILRKKNAENQQTKGLSSTLKNVLGNLTTKLGRSAES